MERIRAFIGISISDHIKSMLKDDFLSGQNLRDVKWVEPVNYHINLKFLDTVSVDRIKEIKDELNSFKGTGTITLRADGLVFFPSQHNPRVVSVGFEPNDELAKLHQSIETILNDNDQRVYTPHITLGRLHKAPNKNIIQDWLTKYNYDFKVDVNSISLYQSTLTEQGPIYKIIHTVSLN